MFEIVTDSCSNLSNELINQYNIHMIPMIYIVDGKERLSYSKDADIDLKSYYNMMRNKVPMSTSCVTKISCEEIFEPILKGGKDLLYIGFSSALSATFSVGDKLLQELKVKYPERKILAVDSLGASLGQGLLVTSVAKLRDEQNMDIFSAYDWAQDNKYKLCHLFTVDTLAYLYKGGRVKKSAYLLASTLNIKPVLNVDNGGNLCATGKVFGRKGALTNLVNRLTETIVNPEEQTIYIGHGDCIEDVEFVITKIKEKVKVKGFYINYIDLVIGTHSGPGTIAIFYYANNR